MTLLSQCIYGGKIDNTFDQRLLHSFLCKLFTPKSFEADFALVANVDGVRIPFIFPSESFSFGVGFRFSMIKLNLHFLCGAITIQVLDDIKKL